MPSVYGCGSKPMGSHFGDFRCTSHFRFPILVVGLVDVHWGTSDLELDPWRYITPGSPGAHLDVQFAEQALCEAK